MKTYRVLYAEDVPVYGSADIEAENDEAAPQRAREIHADGQVYLDDIAWNFSVCHRIVHIEDDQGNIVSEEVSLDDFFLRNGGEHDRLLCDHAEDLLQALVTLIEKADDLQAAIEGVTDQFEDEVAALSAATTAAEKIVKAARGQT